MLTIPNFGNNPPILVTFEHKRKAQSGYFSEVLGAGGYVWYLSVNGFHYGQMIWAEEPQGTGQVNQKDKKYGLTFYSQSGEYDYLADYFIETLILHYESVWPTEADSE